MRHVFVETNWVVKYLAPAHHKMPAAVDLLERSKRGEIKLHVPSICLTEARRPLREKFNPRNEARAIREFIPWALNQGALSVAEAQLVRRVLEMYEVKIQRDLDLVDTALEALRSEAALDVFPVTEQALSHALSLATRHDLNPFDQTILAAILARAAELRLNGERFVEFCELDSDLLPWDAHGRPKPSLTREYDDAAIWVRADFQLKASDSPPDDWPPRAESKPSAADPK